ncbi:MAG: hypothetical protein GY832_13060 [Chloroflexi bacterium]|nr:hypothetical protein [Chloroflexota bacterium]
MCRNETYCDCQGPPWPPMTRLHIPGRYFVCLNCQTVRQEITRPDGTILDVTYHRLDDGTLPQAVDDAAREVLAPPPVQLQMFGELDNL